jgi:hypothetical protein
MEKVKKPSNYVYLEHKVYQVLYRSKMFVHKNKLREILDLNDFEDILWKYSCTSIYFTKQQQSYALSCVTESINSTEEGTSYTCRQNL